MDSLWPWLALAGAGALHGLHPAAGWMFVVCGTEAAGTRGGPRLLLAIAAGHVSALAVLAAAVPLASQWRLAIEPWLLQSLSIVVVLVLLGLHVHGRGFARGPAGPAGLALWAFFMGSAQGAGLVLVPALAALCGAGHGGPRPTLWLALAAIGVHLAGMLASTAMAAASARLVLRGGRKLAGLACPTRSKPAAPPA